MKLIESFCIGKCENTPCEDGWLFNDHYAAVVDGSTSKIKLQHGKESPGHLAMRVVLDALKTLQSDASLEQTLEHLTAALSADSTYALYGYRPTCSATIYSHHHRQVWMIGDCQCRFSGITHHPEKLVDKLLTDMRCRAVRYFLDRGATPDEIRSNDKGRAFIYDALCEQLHFQNDPNPYNPYRYTVLDGQHIHTECVRVIDVPASTELILASDGYPQIADTLSESEGFLAQLLADDPLCIYDNPATKCLMAGNRSFDDRTYIRLRT